MDTMKTRELERSIEYLQKKLKLAKSQLETMKTDSSFDNSDLWILANSVCSALKTQKEDLGEVFGIA